MNKSCKSKWMSKLKIVIVSKPIRRITKQMIRNGYQLFKKCDVFKNANCSKSTNYSKMIFGKCKTVQVVYIKRNSKKDKSTCFHFNKPSGIDKISSKSLYLALFFSNNLPNMYIEDFF